MLPSATEIIYTLGAEDWLCGISCDCDFPPEVSTKPVVSAKVLPITDDSAPADIDTMVRSQLDVSDSIYSLDRELIQDLRPELILAQDLCRVCAVPSGHIEEALEFIGCSAEVLSLDPHSLEEVFDNVLIVGRAVGRLDQAEGFVASARARLEAVRAATDSVTPKRIIAVEWPDPLFIGGHWIPEMITIAGGVDLLGWSRKPSRTVTWREVAEASPEVIVYIPCGYDLRHAVEHLPELFRVPEFGGTPAARDDNVFVLDSSAYFSRSGPRLIDGVEILAGILHPDVMGSPPSRHGRACGIARERGRDIRSGMNIHSLCCDTTSPCCLQ